MERSAAVAGEHADQPAALVDHRGHRRAGRVEPSNAARGSVSAASCTGAGHHLVDLGEPVDLGAVVLGDHAHRPAVLDHERGPVRALGQQRDRLADRLVRVSTIGVSKTRCRCFTQPITSAHHGDRDVLRDHRDAAAAGDGLGHPPAATAVMFATTSGSVVPVPSVVARSTS